MAALTHGPRLGAPSATGFKVWIRADGAGTCVLQTRLTGTTTWTTQDTQAVDTSKYNTCVLTATGLNARTKYDYRVNIDGVDGTTYTTITMPPSGGGRFVAYWVSDGHGANQAVYDYIWTHYQANYDAAGVPAVVIQSGDIANMSNSTLDACSDTLLTELVEMSAPLSRLPLLYMWDDWDYGGNNASPTGLDSGAYPGRAYQSEVPPSSAPPLQWDRLWRDHPRPAAPSFGYSTNIAGVPIIVADARSQREQSGRTPIADGDGSGVYPAALGLYGAAQREWLISELRTASTKGLILFVSTPTFTSQTHPMTDFAAAARDSVGIWYKGERNYVFQQGLGGAFWRNNLVVLTGDDHWNYVRRGRLGKPTRYDHDGLGEDLGLAFTEMKVASGVGISSVGGSVNIHGYADWWNYEGTGHDCVCVFDITSNDSGNAVTARITYRHVSGSDATVGVGGIPGDSCTTTSFDVGTQTYRAPNTGRAGDFWYETGVWSYYSSTLTAVSQLHPVENGVADTRTGERWYVDEINGHLFPESRAVRDDDRRLRDRKDIGDVDRDWLLKYWRPRRELPDREL